MAPPNASGRGTPFVVNPSGRCQPTPWPGAAATPTRPTALPALMAPDGLNLCPKKWPIVNAASRLPSAVPSCAPIPAIQPAAAAVPDGITGPTSRCGAAHV